MERFQPIALTGLPPNKLLRAMRLNCLGSLFYFIRNGLRRKRLTESLHAPLCQTLERFHIKDIIEIPRDCFKTTCASEGLPMWRVLPVSQQDIDEFFALGYSTEFVKWMLKIHDRTARNLLISSNITNAAKIGKRIRYHFESNSIYRTLFPETLPTTNETWTDHTLCVRQDSSTTGGAHGEGTFDFLGVGSAVQSRHYTGIVIQDDLVGLKESESQALIDKAIDYHQLLVGVFEAIDPNHELAELIIGNRWGYSDLNSHVIEHEPEFRVESHSALGGCCALHPPNVPIFPEELGLEKLERYKRRLGSYKFSCQFLNNPSSPEDADFKLDWLNYFTLEQDVQGRYIIKHEVKDGGVMPDIKLAHLALAQVVDPNHSGNAAAGRCKHAILVIAESDQGNYYLIDSWGQSAGYDSFYDQIYLMARKYGLRRVGVETVAAQKYIAHHIEYLNGIKGYSLRVDELKGEVEVDGTMSRKKEWRIRNVVGPIAERGNLWVQRRHMGFINEYQTFPKGKYKDEIDAFAYAPQLLRKPIDWATHMHLIAQNEQRMLQVGKPYSVGVGRRWN